MAFLDSFYRWMIEAIDTVLPGQGYWLAFPLLGIAIVATLSLCAKALTVAGSHLMPTAAKLMLIVLYVVVLSAEYMITRLLRWATLKPFGVIYVVGEWMIQALPVSIGFTRSAGQWWHRESRTLANRKLIIFATLIFVGWWNGTYCDRATGGCTLPSAGFANAVTGFLTGLVN